MRKKLPVLLALIALVGSSLACALGGGEPTLGNTRTAYDEDGAQPSSVFGAFDTIYVVSDLENGVNGNVVSSDWYAESADGVDPNFLIDSVEYTVTDESYDGTIYFFFESPDEGWPAGTYRVEVFFNGVPSATVTFTVQ